LQHHPLLEPDGGVDSIEYARLANQVLQGHVLLGPGLYYLSPLYIYFLAALLGLSDSFTFVRVMQVALGTAAVGCIFVTARVWFGTRAGWCAAALAALTGVFTFYEIVVFQSSIDVFLTAAALACLALALTRPPEAGTSRHASLAAVGTGVFFGLQYLNRPNVIIAAAGILLILLATRRWRLAAFIAAGLTIAVAPLAIRNAIVTHQIALTSSQGGLNFYIGNNAAATGQYVAVPGVRATIAGQSEDTRTVAEARVGHPLSDADVSAYFFGQGMEWVRAHPTAAARLFVRKLALTFNARHQWLDYSYPYYAHDIDSALSALIVGPWLLVPLGLCGAGWLLTRSLSPTDSGATTAAFAVWASFVPLYAVSVAVFFVAERYRLPLLVALCILSGGAIDALLQMLTKRFSGLRVRSAAAIGMGVFGGIVAAWPFQVDDGRFDERLRLSKVLMNQHDYSGAARELEAAFAIRPDSTTTEFNLGMAQVTSGQAQEGIGHVRHAVNAGVPVPGARYALASAMLQTGDRDGAVMLLRTYSPAPDDTAESCYQVAMLAMNAGAPRVAARYAERALELRPGWPAPLDVLQRVR
jgi:4-amino-4-deoxy-L-arabinose transferase-like glycosyltransferase